ncbi:MAG: hypothetical protein HC910_20095 [Spirulinaceae cyanobacterium SM2_1_0]|nr:hypothetical protein [Spirulinaceae cyanobacterium SM2_1_0]
MAKLKILQKDQSYTFHSYFEMNYEVDQILAELGYTFAIAPLILPRAERLPEQLSQLKQDLQQTLPLTRLSSETARREALVAPVLFAVARWCQCQIRVEYPLQVSEQLKGTLDYLLQSPNSLIVVEAKRDDLERGFTQLAVELIAMAQIEEQPVLYGAVTIGEAWRFGRLDREQRQIVQDIDLYVVPDRLEAVVSILLGILDP